MDGARWMTFDCFGTLVDWNGGFRAILEPIAGARAAELVRAYHAYEPAVEAEPFRPYAEVTRIALERAAESIGLTLPSGATGAIAQKWETLPVFNDTVPTLNALRERGWKLGVLTNCDDDLFEKTAARIGVPFDVVVTAQQVRSYKPAREHFKEFYRRTEADRSRWVHAACSWFHDIAPARDLGILRVWIDRDHTGEDPSAASAVLPDLRGLPDTAEKMLNARG